MSQLFTPMLFGTNTRLRLTLNLVDYVKVGRGHPWSAIVTDTTTGTRYLAEGADCDAGPHCFCDATARPLPLEMNLREALPYIHLFPADTRVFLSKE